MSGRNETVAALKAENLSLREQVRELRHELHCERLRADTLADRVSRERVSRMALAEALAAAKGGER